MPKKKKKLIADQNFREVTLARADKKRRLVVKNIVVDKYYRIYANKAGQIVLDPMAVIPEREAWLLKNPKALKKVLQGLAESAAGKTARLNEDFAQYADDDIE